MKTYHLPYGITVTTSPKGEESISSELRVTPMDREDEVFNAKVSAIETFILSQACAGIEIDSPAYFEALETTIEAVLN